MNTINKIIGYLVSETIKMNSLHTQEGLLKIDYATIFCQNDSECEILNKEASKMGIIVEDLPNGQLYKFQKPIRTLNGPLWLLKIRKPNPNKYQRGGVGFVLEDYYSFKEKHQKDILHFKFIEGHFEIIKLQDIKFNVLSYFSNIPLTVQLDIE